MVSQGKEDILTQRHLRDDGERSVFKYESKRDYEERITCGPNIKAINMWPHFHHSLEFLYVERGVLHHDIDGERYDLTPGTLAIIPSFAMHAAQSDENVTRLLLMIPPMCLGNAADLLDHKTFAERVIDDDADGTLHGMLLLIGRAKRREGIFSGLTAESSEHKSVQQALANAFVHAVIARTGLSEIRSSSNLIVEALKYLHLHYTKSIRIPDMARSLLCEQSVLSADFQTVTGMTLNAYINHLRAIRVRLILSENPVMTLEAASALAGFGSVRSMLRAYRQEYGCTPSENR
jgi:AraC-like DNA-binding protein/mannose-6-phosphate isomerase-like protein (cupin superfamily)